MPELPEVETISRGLAAVLESRTVERAFFKRPDIMRKGSIKRPGLSGCRIDTVERTGKNVVIRFDNSFSMVVNLGMSGRLVVRRRGEAYEEMKRKHVHAGLVFPDGMELVFYDPRRFGSILITRSRDIRRVLGIAEDPFQMKPREMQERLEGRSASIKALLLDQKIISGLGNIYADETLFDARIHPLTPGGTVATQARAILSSARKILKKAIAHGGTTFRDYRTHDGERGSFQNHLAVYGRTGEECKRCAAGIERILVAGRSTHFCPRCQELTKRRPASLRSGNERRR